MLRQDFYWGVKRVSVADTSRQTSRIPEGISRAEESIVSVADDLEARRREDFMARRKGFRDSVGGYFFDLRARLRSMHSTSGASNGNPIVDNTRTIRFAYRLAVVGLDLYERALKRGLNGKS
ncbi:MAG: hypothetical protein HYS32_00630 [Candidatus Woesearchaeota archaeon]|nr:MAG: hypothetical protein HYS32_00630 [Candidatus Woesearchaeota archaeon]